MNPSFCYRTSIWPLAERASVSISSSLKTSKDCSFRINIFEIKKPELDATIVGTNIARQVEGKISYRRAIKMAVANTMRAGAEGVKIQICGRLERVVQISSVFAKFR